MTIPTRLEAWQALERLTKELFYAATAEANDMGVLSFHPRFVVVLVSLDVHQVEFVHQAAFLEHLERTIDGDAV